MKNDFDFDELDKAVNSLLNKKDINVPASNQDKKVIQTNDEPKGAIKVEKKTSAKVLRRTGGSMDIVKKTSSTRDTNNNTSNLLGNTSAAKVSRYGTTINPVSKINNKNSGALISEVKTTKSEINHDMNDSVLKDVVKNNSSISKSENSDLEKMPVIKEISSSAKNNGSNMLPDGRLNEPLLTPFLADTKVEKRPLGAFSDLSLSDDDNNLAEPSLSGIEPLPPELSNDVLNAESKYVNENNGFSPARQTTSSSNRFNKSAVSSLDNSKSSLLNSKKEAQKASSDINNIYDNATFHSPMSDKREKMSTWKVILVVLLLVVLGVGIGAVIYFFVMPSL